MEIYNFYFGWFYYNLICILLFLFRNNKIKKGQEHLFVFSACLLFLILALFGNIISPDYWPYKEIVSDISHTKDPFTHIEPVYIWMIQSIGDNFFLYQLSVYLPMFLMLYYLIIYLPYIQEGKFLYWFAILSLYVAIVGRFYLYNIVIILSVIAFGYKKNILGLLLSIISIFLHKLGMIISPILLTCIIFPFSFSKKHTVQLIVIFLVLIVLGRYFIHTFLLNEIELMENINGARYIQRDQGQNAGGSLWWQIIYIFQYGTTILVAIRSLYIFRPLYKVMPLLNKLLYKTLFVLILLVIFYFSLGLPDQTIGSRILGIATIPLCYYLSIESRFFHITSRIQNILMFWGIIYLCLTNCYIIGVSHINLS